MLPGRSGTKGSRLPRQRAFCRGGALWLPEVPCQRQTAERREDSGLKALEPIEIKLVLAQAPDEPLPSPVREVPVRPSSKECPGYSDQFAGQRF